MHRWRIYPDNDVPSRYVTVQIFRTLGEMRAWHVRYGGVTYAASGRKLRSKSRYRNGLAVCRIMPGERQVATCSFTQGYCGPRIVCHEFMHATMGYLHRFVRPEGGTSDLPLIFGELGEQLAYFHGNLCSEFWARYRKAGLPE